MITEKAARSLAIAFEAFCDARNKGNDNSMRVWAGQLIRRQDETGIELCARESLCRLAGVHAPDRWPVSSHKAPALPAWDGGGAATGQAMRRAIEGDEAAANARRRDPLRPLYDRQSVARRGS